MTYKIYITKQTFKCLLHCAQQVDLFSYSLSTFNMTLNTFKL